MNIPTDFHALLAYINSVPLREHEDLKQLARTLQRVLKQMDERDEKGSLTQAAKDARQQCGNPDLKTTHRNTRRRAIQIGYDNQSQKYREALAALIFEGMRTQQIKIELDRYTLSDGETDGPGTSREEHGGKYPLRFVQPFLAALARQEVAPSAFQRTPAFIHDFVAAIYVAASKDPQLEDSKGLLADIARAGVFDLYRGEMTEAEACALDTILAMPECPEILELQRIFTERFPDQPPVSAAFLRGCVRIGDMVDKLPKGTSNA